MDAEGIFTEWNEVKQLKKYQINIVALCISSDLRLSLTKTPKVPLETPRKIPTQ